MIHLDANHLEILREIFAFYIPEGVDVYVFGSRASGEGLKKYSDLDLLIDDQGRIDQKRYLRIKDAFSVSDLPLRTDVLLKSECKESFLSAIDPQLKKIYP